MSDDWRWYWQDALACWQNLAEQTVFLEPEVYGGGEVEDFFDLESVALPPSTADAIAAVERQLEVTLPMSLRTF